MLPVPSSVRPAWIVDLLHLQKAKREDLRCLPMLSLLIQVYLPRVRCEFLFPNHKGVAQDVASRIIKCLMPCASMCYINISESYDGLRVVFFLHPEEPNSKSSLLRHGHCQQASIGPSDASLGSSVWSNGYQVPCTLGSREVVVSRSYSYLLMELQWKLQLCHVEILDWRSHLFTVTCQPYPVDFVCISVYIVLLPNPIEYQYMGTRTYTYRYRQNRFKLTFSVVPCN